MGQHTERHVVLITGASSGIGRAVAHRLARDGHRLVLSSRSGSVLHEVADECRARGLAADDIAVVTADVRDAAAVATLFAAATARFARVDRVVHSAGTIAYGRFEDVPPDVFDATLATDLGGTVHVAREALAAFREAGGGHLIVIGSVLGKVATPTMSSYIAAKWAVHGLVRAVQVELRSTPEVNVTLVSPGGVDTPIYRQGATYLGRHGRPPFPIATPEKVAEVVGAVLDGPRREVPVGVASGLLVLASRVMPAVFDPLLAKLFGPLALDRASGLPDNDGNVLRPLPEGESLHGGYLRSTITGRHADMTDRTNSEHAQDPGPTISRRVDAPATAVWNVLSDGWSYATWVVGASRVRDVDSGWPAKGSRVHHSFGPWPLFIQDFTRVEQSDPGSELILRARGWPVGEALVHITIKDLGPQSSEVVITEDAVAGPGALIPAPLRHLIIAPRNKETLYRLALLAEGRHRESLRE